jgi:hypothetical protein
LNLKWDLLVSKFAFTFNVSRRYTEERTVKYFTETPENSTMMAPRASVPYFL